MWSSGQERKPSPGYLDFFVIHLKTHCFLKITRLKLNTFHYKVNWNLLFDKQTLVNDTSSNSNWKFNFLMFSSFYNVLHEFHY